MSHTTVVSIKTELEHIDLAREKYAKIVHSVRNDIAVTVTPGGKLALNPLLEHAESGVRLADRCEEIILSGYSALASSH